MPAHLTSRAVRMSQPVRGGGGQIRGGEGICISTQIAPIELRCPSGAHQLPRRRGATPPPGGAREWSGSSAPNSAEHTFSSSVSVEPVRTPPSPGSRAGTAARGGTGASGGSAAPQMMPPEDSSFGRGGRPDVRRAGSPDRVWPGASPHSTGSTTQSYSIQPPPESTFAQRCISNTFGHGTPMSREETGAVSELFGGTSTFIEGMGMRMYTLTTSQVDPQEQKQPGLDDSCVAMVQSVVLSDRERGALEERSGATSRGSRGSPGTAGIRTPKKQALQPQLQPDATVPQMKRFTHQDSEVSMLVERQQVLERLREERPADIALYRLQLQEPPGWVWSELSHATALDLSGNAPFLTHLPDGVSQMKSLKKLVLTSNALTSLPQAVCTLAALEHLGVGNNRLTELPEGLAQLPSLAEVNSEWNCLSVFPLHLCQSQSLRLLNLAENPSISVLPDALCSLGPAATVRLDNDPRLVAEAARLRGLGSAPSFIWNQVFPDKIGEGLYLGSLRAAQTRVCNVLGLTHIATIGRELRTPDLPPQVKQFRLMVDDVPETDMLPLLRKAHSFIDGALGTKGGACLVHCFKGQSRSTTVITTYLMTRQRRRCAEVLQHVRSCRPCIAPNEGFLKQMEKLEVDLGLSPSSSAASTAPAAQIRSPTTESGHDSSAGGSRGLIRMVDPQTPSSPQGQRRDPTEAPDTLASQDTSVLSWAGKLEGTFASNMTVSVNNALGTTQPLGQRVSSC